MYVVQSQKVFQALDLGNPRFYWCYADEDLQRLVKGVATSVHIDNMAENILYKYLCYHFR